MKTNERYAHLAEERNKLLNDNVDLTTFNWYENLVPIAEPALTDYATILNIKNIQNFIAFIR